MTEYLVGVEHPTGHEEENIVVTNDMEGFGPSLLATFPVWTIEACQPQEAAYHYAKALELTHLLVRINLPDNSEEWWMCADEVHKIDTDAETVWEPDEEHAGELDKFFSEVIRQYHSTREDGGDHIDAVADVLVPEGYTIVKTEAWQDMCDKVNDRSIAAAEDGSPPILPRELFTVFITNEEILCWEVWDDETVFSILTGEAYGRWLVTEPEKARSWEGRWEGHVMAELRGYRVRLTNRSP